MKAPQLMKPTVSGGQVVVSGIGSGVVLKKATWRWSGDLIRESSESLASVGRYISALPHLHQD